MESRYLYEFISHEKVMPIKCFIVGIDRFSHHWHKDLEFIFLLKGSIRLYSDGNEHLLRKGDVVLLNSHAMHSFDMTEEDNIVLILQFEPEVYQSIYETGKAFLFQCNSAASDGMQEEGFRLLRTSLAEIAMEIYCRKDGYQFFIKSSLFRLMGDLFRYFPYSVIDSSQQETRSSDMDRLRHIVEHLYDNIREAMSVESVAHRENMSVSYFCHFFKRMSGISFLGFLMQVRIDRAKDLLLHSDYTVLRIAEECGFGNVTSLYRVFGKKVGMSPGDYRARGQSDDRQKARKVHGYTLLNPDFGFGLLSEYLPE